MADQENLRCLYMSWVNIIKIMRYRGYIIPKDFDLTLEEFTETYGDKSLKSIKEYMSDELLFEHNGVTLMAVWVEKNLGTNVQDVYEMMIKKGATKALVVVETKVTSQASNILGMLRTTKRIFIDVWTMKESMIFVPDHKLVPKHRICSVKEKKRVLQQYGCRPNEIPQIGKNDVMVKYLGAAKGQLIEIIRQTDADSKFYIKTWRCVAD